jgi:hypothetical protein
VLFDIVSMNTAPTQMSGHSLTCPRPGAFAHRTPACAMGGKLREPSPYGELQPGSRSPLGPVPEAYEAQCLYRERVQKSSMH